MNDIVLKGVATHNLQLIDVVIPKNRITTIYGRSGAGKTSLAFASLYQLCKDEFDAIENGFFDLKEYVVQDYSGLIPAVAVSQNNTNNNPRSTLYSYLNIAQLLSSTNIQSHQYTIPDFAYLKLNRPLNQCPTCNGLGEVVEISFADLVDENLTIAENPFSCWKKGTFAELYTNLLIAFCESQNIDIHTPFKKLSKKVQTELLYSTGSEKLNVRFKHKGKTRYKKKYYEGAMNYAQQNLDVKAAAAFSQKISCSQCQGSRLSSKCREQTVLNMTMQQLMTLSLSDLLQQFDAISYRGQLRDILFALCQLGLGYLHLARAIPTLSGGELQKLRFSRLLSTEISGILIVIDEISSQLGEQDYKLIQQKIRKLAGNNTVVLVEHAQYFIDHADNTIHIGKYAGKQGGQICQSEVISTSSTIPALRKSKDFLIFNDININNVIGQSVHIPQKCMSVITGVSGSGKSSVARVIQQRNNSIYISQKSSRYSSRSVLAATLRLSRPIASFFLRHHKDKYSIDDFLLNKNAGCKTCSGIGVVKYERGFDSDLYLPCPQCNGNLFNENHDALYECVNGKNIMDIYAMEISELEEYFAQEKTIAPTLYTLQSLGLGHLQLSRKTQTLSGGEIRRIKLSECLSRQRETEKILIIDEPAAGLDPETADKVAQFIHQQTYLFAAIIIIEHRSEVIKLADYRIQMGPGAGNLGGKVLHQGFQSR